MLPFEEHELMAYADGELEPARARQLAEAAAQDTGLTQRIERYAATRRLLHDRFESVAAQPVPERLLRLLQEPESKPYSRVVQLPTRPARPAPRPVWVALALAASLVAAVGLMSAKVLWSTPDPFSLALESAASGEPYAIGAGEVMPLSSLQVATGEYCREYERSEGGASSRGLACRGAEGRWTERTLPSTPADETAGDYQMASGEDTDVAVALRARRLSPDEEREQIRQCWRKASGLRCWRPKGN